MQFVLAERLQLEETVQFNQVKELNAEWKVRWFCQVKCQTIIFGDLRLWIS